ncbi:MAG: hypothetical protein GF417_06360 [Candidatus Latescibacteria bacterium]|nr:hypothetical protein [bacterium]MBD3424041.1 hypothetical protein [Candidatus Latescibacterota bacterium]
MRRNGFLYISLALILSVAVMAGGCGKEDGTAGPQLLEALNQNPFGLEYRVDGNNISSTGEKGGHRVIFEDAELIFDTAILKETALGENIKEQKVPIAIDEIAFLYKPKEDYLECLYMKGMHFKWDLADMVKLPDSTMKEGAPEMDLDFRAGKMQFTDYNLSPMLTYKGDDIWEFAEKFMEHNQSVNSVMKDFTYKINLSDIGKGEQEPGDLNMEFSIGEMSFTQKSISTFFVNLYRKDATIPNLDELLDKGEPLFDMNASMKEMNFSFSGVDEGEKVSGKGALADAEVSYYVKPDEEKTHFNFGLDYHLGAVELDIPAEDAKEAVEIIEGLERLNLDFSLKHLSPQLVKTYLEMTRDNITMQGDPEKMKQAAAGSGQQLLGQLMQSQPVLSVSISPLEHEIGKMELNADFSMPAMMTPDGKAVVKIYDLEKVLTAIKNMKGFSEQDFNNFSQWAAMMLRTDDQGNGVMTFEMKQEEPGVRYLNGQRMN